MLSLFAYFTLYVLSYFPFISSLLLLFLFFFSVFLTPHPDPGFSEHPCGDWGWWSQKRKFLRQRVSIKKLSMEGRSGCGMFWNSQQHSLLFLKYSTGTINCITIIPLLSLEPFPFQITIKLSPNEVLNNGSHFMPDGVKNVAFPAILL